MQRGNNMSTFVKLFIEKNMSITIIYYIMSIPLPYRTGGYRESLGHLLGKF